MDSVSIIKDYVIPMVTPFATAFGGYYSAKWASSLSDNIKSEVRNVENANFVFYDVMSINESLISIKLNYKNDLSPNPIQRIFDYLYIINSPKKIKNESRALSFFGKKMDVSDGYSYDDSWFNVRRINMLIENYNVFIDMFNKRNDLRLIFQNRLIESCRNEVSTSEIISKCEDIIFNLLDLNEKCIYFLDDLLIESSDFLKNYNKTLSAVVNKKLIKKRIGLLAYVGNQKTDEALVRCIDVDYSSLSKLTDKPENFWRNNLNFGYRRNSVEN